DQHEKGRRLGREGFGVSLSERVRSSGLTGSGFKAVSRRSPLFLSLIDDITASRASARANQSARTDRHAGQGAHACTDTCANGGSGNDALLCIVHAGTGTQQKHRTGSQGQKNGLHLRHSSSCSCGPDRKIATNDGATLGRWESSRLFARGIPV